MHAQLGPGDGANGADEDDGNDLEEAEAAAAELLRAKGPSTSRAVQVRRHTRSRPTTSSKRSPSPLRKDLKVRSDQYLQYWGYCALTRRVERREEGSLTSQKSDTCQMAGSQKNRMRSSFCLQTSSASLSHKSSQVGDCMSQMSAFPMILAFCATCQLSLCPVSLNPVHLASVIAFPRFGACDRR